MVSGEPPKTKIKLKRPTCSFENPPLLVSTFIEPKTKQKKNNYRFSIIERGHRHTF